MALKNVCFSILLLYFISAKSDAYRILVIAPLNAKSHTNMLESVAKALAIKGHQVDVISHFDLKNAPKNYKTIINLNGTMESLVGAWSIEKVTFFRETDLIPNMVQNYGNNYCDLMGLEEMQKLIKNPPKDPPYDLFITEALSANCYIGFGHVLKVPVVLVSALIEFPWFDEILGNPRSTAFAVNLDTENGQISSYWDRVKNTFWTHYNTYRYFKLTDENQTAAMRKYLSPDIPSLREVEKSVALLVVNAYQSMFGIRPFNPAIVQAAGIQIELSDTKMSPELKNWMDESVHGVVFFSLGSMVILEDLSEDILFGLYASFAKLAPTRVLMKIVNKENLPPGLPENVLTMSWIPQIPILRHNNTRLFMTHGGLNSIQEALYFGVPMIAFPLFGDQMLNIQLLVAKNVAYEIDYRKITQEAVDKALNAVLYDPKYREAAKHESHLFKDRPISVTDNTVFWIEYVIRNGANSLRSPAMDLKWWQIELLDVYALFLFCIFLISFLGFIVLKIVHLIICQFLHSNSQNHKKKD